MAMPKVFPCLWFDGHAEEAAEFYVTLLPDSHVDNVWRSPAETPSGPAGMVLTVDFTVAGQQLQGLNGGPEFRFNEAVSFVIECEDQAEVDRLWESLAANGGETRTLRLAEGPVRGVLADRPAPVGRVGQRCRPRARPPGDGGDAHDGQDRGRRAGARCRRGLSTARLRTSRAPRRRLQGCRS